MKRHVVIMSPKAKHNNLEITRFLIVAKFFVRKVRKELLSENSGVELASTRKRKQHGQRSADSLTTPEFVSLRANAEADADADAYVGTLRTIVFEPPWIESIVSGGQPYVFQQDSAPSHKALKTQDYMGG
ncbi:unnamed protein product [Hymenolepis diminuta]|uniref:Uncharacterized protein n=1 Tax=Hymenolepis diminuta TaxID=6216 RepID=A0A564YSF4_HYMDI|nr:unnamed protein product [Hymenolepis diminuta]